MKKLINLTELLSGLQRAWRQYPESNAAGVVTLVAAAMLSRSKPDAQLWAPILLAAMLGLPLGFALAARRIRTQAEGWRAWLPTMVALVALVGYAFWVDDRYQIHYVRFFVLNAVVHLAVAVAPFLQRGNQGAFWHYNRLLLMRALLTGIYTATVLIGVMAALSALKALFNVELYDEQYLHTTYFCAFVLNTAIFTAGAPARFDEETTEETYPQGLLNFVQYILLPLVTVYLLILYAYGVNVTFGEAPKGIISYLVIAFSVVGVLGLLLAFPLRESASKGWIKWYTRFFYPLLLPLAGLLFYAIWLRIADYGLTEKRVLLLYLGLWLGGIALYFTVRRRVDIKLIPLSLAVVSLVAAVGPLSIGDLSKGSQNARLTQLVTEAGLLKDGKYIRPSTILRDSLAMEITSMVSYFSSMHGLNDLDAWAQPMITKVDSGAIRADSIGEIRYGFQDADGLLKQLNVERTAVWDWENRNSKKASPYFDYKLSGDQVSIQKSWTHAWFVSFDLSSTTLTDTVQTDGVRWLMKANGDFYSFGDLSIQTSFGPTLLRLYAEDSLASTRVFTPSDTSFMLRHTYGPWQLDWQLTHISGAFNDDSLRLTKAEGILYLSKRARP